VSFPGVTEDGRLIYAIDGTGRYTSEDILHIRGFGTNGRFGLSRIQQARNALGMLGDMEEFAGRFWGAGAVNAVVLKHPNRLTPVAHENLRTSVKAKLGAAGGGDPWVLEEGMDVSTLTMPLDDAQFIEQRRMNNLDVALLFRIPPKMLGAATGDSLTYTSSEWEGLDFVRWSFARRWSGSKGQLKRDPNLFIQGRRFYPEFLIDALMRGTSRSARSSTRRRWIRCLAG
jgi:HK97 family phage portal protein